MMRLFLISVMFMSAALLFIQGRLNSRTTEMPVFLRTDKIAEAHHTDISISVHSIFKPDAVQLETLKRDYSNLWAHLNYVYASNDVNPGKEYYTENWFRQICRHYEGAIKTLITRTDEQHELHIENWAPDGLVCTAIDSNVVLSYHYPDQPMKKSKVTLAVVLLFQGDHWRIDALRVLKETPHFTR